MKLRVLVADDHFIVLEGLCRVFERGDYVLVGTVTDGRALVRAAADLKPDVIILDISMPLLNGVEAAHQIRQHNSTVKLIFLSMHDEAEYIRQAFRAGANGYVLKSSGTAELLVAIDEVMQGRRYISPLITLSAERALAEIGSSHGFGNHLSPRQREVLQLVAEGKTAKEAASILHISIKTVDFHKTNIMDVLGVRSQVDLTRYAVQHGLVGK